MMSISHPISILYGGGVALACGVDGELHADQLHGLFAGDTRVLSTYRWTIAGHSWRLLARSRPGPATAQWDMQNPTLSTPAGELVDGTVHFRLRRRVVGALHDDVTITSYGHGTRTVRLALQIDADFADVFEVKGRSIPPRLGVRRAPRSDGLHLVFTRRDFRRGLQVTFVASAGSPTWVGARAVFEIVLEPHRPWHCCVEAVPEIDGLSSQFEGDPHGEDRPTKSADVAIRCASLLETPFERGCLDLEELAIRDLDSSFVAAGAPWFMALFGRDSLMASLMASLIGSWHARGALAALGRTQARVRDDFRDAEPGKIAHELRRGELAHFHLVPHAPYYGSHDAPALYVLALWNAIRWTGERALLDRHLDTARAALDWCEKLGDRDGDGLLEYCSRSEGGYRNQGWKDAGDALIHDDGTDAELPIATVELQGYWYAARLAMAELLEAEGSNEQATRLREEALQLRTLIEERFWLEESDCYALALDGKKRVVRSIASNAGHLLWCGVPSYERARRLADRLLRDDLFSGYGLRTISAAHVRYNPLSYQLGSVWPHDTALFAAGLARYGLRDESARVLKAILDAAQAFEQDRLPELFCGFSRGDGPPVPYEEANVPQAWAAAVPILATQLFLGLVPDAARGRCYLTPWLPDWLPSLIARGIPVGEGKLEVHLVRDGITTRVEKANHPTLDIVFEATAAPLWGSVQGVDVA